MNNNKILVVAVHPDDESLGAGGSLFKWKSEGKEIHWLILTTVDPSLGTSPERCQKRSVEIEKVAEKYNFKSFTQLKFLTTRLDTYSMSELVAAIGEVINAIKPEALIIPHRFDAHSDHRVAYEALMPFLKSFRYPFIKKVLSMETISETEYSAVDIRDSFVPNYFVDITNELPLKLDVLKEYEGEMAKHPFPRSNEAITAQALLRGARIGSQYAEAFQVLKMVEG